MSFEAIPCMLKSQEGQPPVIGILIRATNQADGNGGIGLNSSPGPSGSIPITAPSQFMRTNGKRVCIANTHQLKGLVPGTQIRLGQPGRWNNAPSAITISPNQRMITAGAQHNIITPQLVELSCSPSCPIQSTSSADATSTTYTPSSIQSLPNTPPQTSMVMNGQSDIADEETSYDDMPRLLPVDHYQSTISVRSPSIPPPQLDESSFCHGSECETSLPPSISISSTMCPDEIAAQLYTTMGSEKMQMITSLILEKTAKDDIRKNSMDDLKNKKKKIVREEKEVESTVSSPCIPHKKRRLINNEWKEKERRKRESSEDIKESEEEPIDIFVQYRLAVRRQLNAKVNEVTEKVCTNLSKLSMDDKRKRKYIDVPSTSSSSHFSSLQWDIINKRQKLNLSQIVNEMKKKRKEIERRIDEEEKDKNKRILNDGIIKNKLDINVAKRLRRKRSRGENEMIDNYEVIESNVIDESISSLSIESIISVECQCLRGSCISSYECSSRASRIFCNSSICHLPTCLNRLSSTSSLCIHKGNLVSKGPKKANEFLGEFVGEVISVDEMDRRISSSSSPIRAFALSPNHFIDGTRKGNIIRFVKHSCQPNCVLQVWYDNGQPHLCLFSRFNLGTLSEISVDFSHITPYSFKCNCSSRRCHETIVASLSIGMNESISSSHPCDLFLRRNIRQRRNVPRCPSSLSSITNSLIPLSLLIDMRFRRIDGGMPRELGYLMHTLRRAAIDENVKLFVYIISRIEENTLHPIDTHSLTCIRNRLLIGKETKNDEDKRKRLKKDFIIDESYIDDNVKIGSYNADEWIEDRNDDVDAVRCICGISEDDGEMVQCDGCQYWLHSDCITYSQTDKYTCPICLSSTQSPHGDVKLKKQPSDALYRCTYYKALENDKGLQIRLNECIYIELPTNNTHRTNLSLLQNNKKDVKDNQEWNSITSRKEVNIFRVIRLFVSPSGNRFVFGFIYARPHQTFSEEKRQFHPKEVFMGTSDDFFHTIPLNAVHGKCVVMEPALYCSGRPLYPRYKEEDVFFCQFKLINGQRNFKLFRSPFEMNTEPYAFRKFENEREIKRCFTPFVHKSSAHCPLTLLSQEDATLIFREKSKERIDRIAKGLTSSHV